MNKNIYLEPKIINEENGYNSFIDFGKTRGNNQSLFYVIENSDYHYLKENMGKEKSNLAIFKVAEYVLSINIKDENEKNKKLAHEILACNYADDFDFLTSAQLFKFFIKKEVDVKEIDKELFENSYKQILNDYIDISINYVYKDKINELLKDEEIKKEYQNLMILNPEVFSYEEEQDYLKFLLFAKHSDDNFIKKDFEIEPVFNQIILEFINNEKNNYVQEIKNGNFNYDNVEDKITTLIKEKYNFDYFSKLAYKEAEILLEKEQKEIQGFFKEFETKNRTNNILKY